MEVVFVDAADGEDLAGVHHLRGGGLGEGSGADQILRKAALQGRGELFGVVSERRNTVAWACAAPAGSNNATGSATAANERCNRRTVDDLFVMVCPLLCGLS